MPAPDSSYSLLEVLYCTYMTRNQVYYLAEILTVQTHCMQPCDTISVEIGWWTWEAQLEQLVVSHL